MHRVPALDPRGRGPADADALHDPGDRGLEPWRIHPGYIGALPRSRTQPQMMANCVALSNVSTESMGKPRLEAGGGGRAQLEPVRQADVDRVAVPLRPGLPAATRGTEGGQGPLPRVIQPEAKAHGYHTTLQEQPSVLLNT